MRRIPDYGFAISSALETLEDAEIDGFPVDLSLFFSRYQEFALKTYSDYAKLMKTNESVLVERHGEDGFVTAIDGTIGYTILYNPNKKQGRLRFTIAHELGHIILGHLEEFGDLEQLKSMDRSLYDELEKETNCFARNLLSPAPYAEKLLVDHGFDCSFSQTANRMVWNRTKDTDTTVNLRYVPSATSLLRIAFNISDDAGRWREVFLSSDVRYATEWKKNHKLTIPINASWVCRDCGAKRIGMAMYCTNCGAHNRFEFMVTYASDPLEVKVTDSNQFLSCPFCGNDSFSSDAEFCKVCGLPLFNHCTKHYEHLNHPESSFCWQCGSSTEFNEKGYVGLIKRRKSQ